MAIDVGSKVKYTDQNNISHAGTVITFSPDGDALVTLEGNDAILSVDENDLVEIPSEADKLKEEIIEILENANAYPEETITDVSIASFPDGADDIPVKALTVQIAPVQLGNDDPSPTNVRPIFGVRRLRIYTAQEFALGRQTVEYTAPNGDFVCFSIDAIGEGLSYAWEFKAPGGSTWTISSLTGSIIRSEMRENRDGRRYRCTVTDSGGHTIQTDDMVMRLGSTVSAVFENGDVPYVETDLSALAGTVYGGTLNVLTGALTVTHGYIASYNGETLPGAWISSMDVYAEGTSPTVGAQVVYALASPQSYQLTPVSVETLYGSNLIAAFGDDGLVSAAQTIASLTYRADIETYINGHLS